MGLSWICQESETMSKDYLKKVGANMASTTTTKYPINGYAPGQYHCKCGDCKNMFIGDKRAIRCEPCAMKIVENPTSAKNAQVQTSKEIDLRIRNLMRLFLNDIRDYEGECNEAVCKDERESSEFVDVFLDSVNAFDYVEIIKLFETKQPPQELVKQMFDTLPNSIHWADAHLSSEKCAQIAVGYTEEENKLIKKSYEPLSDLLWNLTNGELGLKLPKYRKEEMRNAIIKFEKQLLKK